MTIRTPSPATVFRTFLVAFFGSKFWSKWHGFVTRAPRQFFNFPSVRWVPGNLKIFHNGIVATPQKGIQNLLGSRGENM